MNIRNKFAPVPLAAFLMALLLSALSPVASADTALIPAMTANNAPAGTAYAISTFDGSVCGHNPPLPYLAFDQSNASAWMASPKGAGALGYQSPAPMTIGSYSLIGWSSLCAESDATRALSAWTAYNCVVSPCVEIETRSGITFGNGEKQTFTLATPVTTTDFRIAPSNNNGGGDYTTVIALQVYGTTAAPPPPPPPPVVDAGAFTMPVRAVFPLPALPSTDLLAGVVPAIPALEGYSEQYYDILVATQNNAQAGLSAGGGAVFVLGDSIVTMLDVRQIPGGFNAGIGSDTFAGILGRMAGYTALHNAHAIVLLAGHNNAYFGQSLATMQDHFARIVNWRTGRFVWVPIPPTTMAGAANPAASLAVANAFNAWAATYLAGMPNVAIADLTGISVADMSDGTHPNAVNVGKLDKAITRALATLQ